MYSLLSTAPLLWPAPTIQRIGVQPFCRGTGNIFAGSHVLTSRSTQAFQFHIGTGQSTGRLEPRFGARTSWVAMERVPAGRLPPVLLPFPPENGTLPSVILAIQPLSLLDRS